MGLQLLRKILFVSALVVAPSAFAALTLGTISGVSSQDLTDLTKPIIYGGFTGGCTTDGSNNTTTCDSCAVAPTTDMTVCNQTNAYDNLIVTFTLTTTTAGFAYTDARVVVGSGTPKTGFTNPPQYDAASGTLTLFMTWSEICGLFSGGTGATTCTNNISGEMVISLKNSTSEESITVLVRTRVEAAGPKDYEDCNDTSVALSANWGVCHFEAFRGDGKIYAKNLVYTPTYPTNAIVAGVPYDGVVFFYEEDDTGSGNQTALLAKVSSRSKSHSILANTSSSKLSDNRVTGLKNDVEYCMLMGNRDKSGIISGFTPRPSTGQTTIDQLCQMPSLVVGLLDDKKCFIATAAFGSPMAPEVESFREFRNHFLLTNPIGKAFVRAYYKHSPYFANLIAESEIAKAVVRAALWPLLVFARVSLVFGFWMTLFFTAVSGLGIYEVYRRFFVNRRFRGEL
ncbi:hypothetical protein AZI86_08915 [Bdellovibrio bacteriovorus]|uniref:Uncharacterized protein n=1 Tax=Bdellovibrio bacteriovorus TaxID=959 RepID=A0A150WRI6_BDEBC|nr:hypothetical protein AZI86_08915 [Bdellovibrio bacteriovorus]